MGKNWTNSYGETCGTGQLKSEWIIFMFPGIVQRVLATAWKKGQGTTSQAENQQDHCLEDQYGQCPIEN